MRFFDKKHRDFAAEGAGRGVSMELDHRLNERPLEVLPMKSEYPNPLAVPCPEELSASPSRLLDEKVSDNTGTEAKVDSAFAPAGLKNPFWK
jgi:hypothetical protein